MFPFHFHISGPPIVLCAKSISDLWSGTQKLNKFKTNVYIRLSWLGLGILIDIFISCVAISANLCKELTFN